MEIRVLKYFLETAREGSVTRAAAALHLAAIAVETAQGSGTRDGKKAVRAPYSQTLS